METLEDMNTTASKYKRLSPFLKEIVGNIKTFEVDELNDSLSFDVWQSTWIEQPKEDWKELIWKHRKLPSPIQFVDNAIDKARGSLPSRIKFVQLGHNVVQKATATKEICVLMLVQKDGRQHFVCLAKSERALKLIGMQEDVEENLEVYKTFINARYGRPDDKNLAPELLFHDYSDASICRKINCICLPMITLAQAFVISSEDFPDDPALPEQFENLGLAFAELLVRKTVNGFLQLARK